MALDKHYGDFAGLDVTTNLLKQRPDSCRDGSINNIWNYQDQMQKREGFQHKSDGGSTYCDAALMEYIYIDKDSGQQVSQILTVGLDGFLYRIRKDLLKIAYDAGAGGTIAYYSLFYDEVALTHKVVFYNSSNVSLGSVNISTSMTLDQLSTAINALALTGLTCTVSTEAGGSSSSKKAYLLDTKYKLYFNSVGVTTDPNNVMYEEKVPTPDLEHVTNLNGTLAFRNSQVNHQNGTEFEGLSWKNLNNAFYITDGGFVYKYDQGGICYRAGMPDLNRYKGWDIANSAVAGDLDTAEDYRYSFQLCNVDVTGSLVASNTLLTEAVTGDNAYAWYISGLQDTTFSSGWNPNKHFPIYSCCSGNSDQQITTSNFTFTVKTGHNIKVGMSLRFHEKPNDSFTPTAKIGYRYLPVTAVTDTSITVSGSISILAKQANINDTSFIPGDAYIWANTVINGCYLPTDYQTNLIYVQDSTNGGMKFHPTPIYGAFLRIGRTLGDGLTFYELYDAPIPHNETWEYLYNDTLKDAETTYASSGLPSYTEYNGLSRIPADVLEISKELPRSCKYLAIWENQLTQAGSDVEFFELYIKNQPYPSFNKYGTGQITNGIDFTKYQDNDNCESNSAYWCDVENPEGFPQSGANEEDFKYIHKDAVTGIFANKEALFVFKNRTTGYLSGSPATGDIVKEFLEADIGCATNQTVQDVGGAIVFMDENLGFWSVIAGRLPVFIGSPILDYFKNNNKLITQQKLRFKLARSANYREQDQYICWVQAGERNPATGASAYSVMFVLDYSQIGNSKRNCWHKWNGLNAGGGVLATSEGDLLISSYGTGINRIWKQKFTGSKYDFSDHTSAIEFNYKGAFLTLGEPTIDKSWIRCVINSISGGFNLVVQQYANFIDTVASDYTLTMPAESSTKVAVKMDVKASIPKLSGISWGFYNNDVNADVKIDGWEVEYTAPFDKGEPKK